MNIKETKFKGCFLIEPKIFTDQRGIFFELFRKDALETKLGYEIDFVQENQSISKKGVLRGLHFQKGETAQAKLVTVTKGEVLDVVVDLREGSQTYGEHLKIRLSDKNHHCLFIPRGMAHGFLTLSQEAIFSYKCDNYYNPTEEGGIIYHDGDLNIDWEVPIAELLLSEKDLNLPTFKSIRKSKRYL